MAGLPFMGDVTYAAHFHSMKWWFDSIGNGTAQGFTKEGPAPDGILCDAATPCAAGATDTCAWYKQGDGLVPLHDWTMEETLSGVMMMAEMLLVSRNRTGAAYFMPLFMRTSNLLESRRDPANNNLTFLTGPSTNLLAPSFGGGPNGTRAYLAGVSITYAAALNRLIELATLVDDSVALNMFVERRDATMAGLGEFLEAATNATVSSAKLAGDRFHASEPQDQIIRQDDCTPAGDLCGESHPQAAPCCGNASCRQDYWCGGAPPPPDRPYMCFNEPPPPSPDCHQIGESCKAKSDCCLSPICNRVFCDTQTSHCAETPPPPASSDFVAASSHYFVRSIDPESSGGARHGVLGAQQFGYFEASPNHDAVAWRVVNDSLAEEIMGTIDGLGSALRPYTFILPNTDAGGGGGYDDMLCSDGSTWCNGITRGGIFAYGTWVNGGVWTTQEARAILAYFRTGRINAAIASYTTMLKQRSRSWTMDAPLPNFGRDTWAKLPVMLTIDSFGCAAAILRGPFEYLYAANSLTLIPHLPDTVTTLKQNFGVRWGPYRLFIATTGVPSSGIASVAINGVPVTASSGISHTFNASAIVLQFAGMPPASDLAASAPDSDISTAHDAISIVVGFKASNTLEKVATPSLPLAQRVRSLAADLPSGYSFRVRAADLAATLKPGDKVVEWSSTAPGMPATTLSVPSGYGAPKFTLDAQGRPSVLFHDIGTNKSALAAPLELPSASSLFAVMRDDGSIHMYSSVVHLDNDRGIAVDPLHCATGNPQGPRPCGPHAARTLAIDYAGSGDHGKRNISATTLIGAVLYAAQNATSFVDGCTEQQFDGEVVQVAPASPSSSITLGLRMDSMDRQFEGAVLEVVAYPGTLDANASAAVVHALRNFHNVPARDCKVVAPPTPAPAPAPPAPTSLNCSEARVSLNCTSVSWARKCGLSEWETERLATFVAKLEAAGKQTQNSLPYVFSAVLTGRVFQCRARPQSVWRRSVFAGMRWRPRPLRTPRLLTSVATA
eukprot:INCI15842.4.p1 GENE.INCI15842.4~~INCI15842.4.p1  ORF type:complete len:1009 (+),score=144.97 INCI15842.4:571-3597(+)